MEGGEESGEGWRRRERVSPLCRPFFQAVNALLGGFRPLLCVHRDPVPPRDISPPFSAFTSTLTSFSTTFSGTFYPPLLFTRTPPPPLLPSFPFSSSGRGDVLARLEATILLLIRFKFRCDIYALINPWCFFRDERGSVALFLLVD